MPATTYLANKLLEHQVGKTAFTMPTAYIAVTNGTSEPSTGNYQRKVTSAADWTVASGGVISNANVISLNTATADWLAGANLTTGEIWDAVSAGNKLATGTLTVAKNVLNGDTLSIPVGGLTITFS